MTEAALRGNGMPGPIAPVAVNADDLYLFGTVSQRDPVDYFGEGRDAVRAADCRALATCDAKRLAWMEELGLRIPQLAFAALMLVIAGLARYAASRMTARVEPPENGFVTLLCGFTYAAWVLLLLEVYWVLNPHVGIAALFFGNALIETGLVVAGSGILLGGAMAWDRQHATRLRVFTLVMVPIALACGYVAAFRCGVSPYTLTVVCR